MPEFSNNILLHFLQFAALLALASVVGYLCRAVVYLGERIERLEENNRE